MASIARLIQILARYTIGCAELFLTVVLVSIESSQGADDLTQPIRVSDNGHFLVQPDGQPFFWLGDTAWPLFVRLDRSETDHYLRDRASKGFNVIQAVIMGGPWDGLGPNRYGEAPLLDDDPRRPNPRYFDHVEWVVDRAARYGIRMALLPTWGLNTIDADENGKSIFDAGKAEMYGKWIASRYRDKGIIWVLGGDTIPIWPSKLKFQAGSKPDNTPQSIIDYRPIYDAMAEGIKGIQGAQAFITYHPCGLSFSGISEPRTSEFFHDRPWLDMNMLQSSHFNDPSVFFKFGFASGWNANFSYQPVAREYQSSPTRPVIDAETRYEGEPVDVLYSVSKGFWKAQDSRNGAYHAVFSGAAGHTYGNNSVHQFFDPTRERALEEVRSSWQIELDSPGSQQMKHIKHLMLSRPYLTRIPDQSVIVGDAGEGFSHASGTRDQGGSYIMIYLPQGQPVTVKMEEISGPSAIGWWFDPRTGRSMRIEGVLQTNHDSRFIPPSNGPEDDWVLVIDNAAIGFKEPGAVAYPTSQSNNTRR